MKIQPFAMDLMFLKHLDTIKKIYTPQTFGVTKKKKKSMQDCSLQV